METESPDPLDELLDLDTVDVPVGLSGRVLRRVEDQGSSSAPDVQVPRRRGPWIAILAAAAAGLLAVLGWRALVSADPDGRSEAVAVGEDEPLPMDRRAHEPPSEELLALLPLLENLDFLTEELDPLEADALFLFDTEDQLLFEILEADGSGDAESEVEVKKG